MANNKSAEKRIRQIKTRTERNRSMLSRVKTLRKKTLSAAEAGNHEEARNIFREFCSSVDKAAKKNIFHSNKAANLKSRTNKAIRP